jgi:hypothetical protein
VSATPRLSHIISSSSPEDVSRMFFRNFSMYLQAHTMSQLKDQHPNHRHLGQGPQLCAREHHGAPLIQASDYRLGNRGSIPGRGIGFSSSLCFQLRPTQPPIQCVPEVLSPGAKSGRGVTLATYPHLVSRSKNE